ncbi:MAG: BrnA antitoxin family protein [Halioglobus sp.]|nr:BrnA antitoxin family protein [Halioglobus sp.]
MVAGHTPNPGCRCRDFSTWGARKTRKPCNGSAFWRNAEVASFPNLKPSTRTISLRLPEGLLDSIKIEANKRDMPYQSLIKAWRPMDCCLCVSLIATVGLNASWASSATAVFFDGSGYA